MYVLCLHNFPTQADCIIVVFFLSLSFYNILKVGMPKNVSQSEDTKKWPMDANFQVPASTGHKVEKADTNAYVVFNLFQFRPV